ncbi:MAG: hypothetical protein Q9157_004583 [Trypethelium eluteriae]
MRPRFQDDQIRYDPHSLALQHLSLRPPLAHLRMQVLQTQDMSLVFDQAVVIATVSTTQGVARGKDDWSVQEFDVSSSRFSKVADEHDADVAMQLGGSTLPGQNDRDVRWGRDLPR